MLKEREYTKLPKERREILLEDSVPSLDGDGEVRYYCPERNQQADIKKGRSYPTNLQDQCNSLKKLSYSCTRCLRFVDAF